jgi:hypothetical protein
MNILEKLTMIPSKIKDYILIGLLVSVVLIVIIMSINNFNEVRRQVEIEKTKNELIDTKIQVEQDKEALEDNVKTHDSFIQITVNEIKNITRVKPKKIKYEEIEIPDTTYIAMRSLLDTIQPNK